MLSCSIWFSAPSFWMGGGLESRWVGRMCGADGAVHGKIRLVRMYCIIIITTEDHNRVVLFHVHLNALFDSAHPNIFVLVFARQEIQNDTYIKIRSITTRRFKKSATSSKIGQYRANLISRTEFVSSVSYKFIPNTNLCFLIPCIYNATCHLRNCACYSTKDNR